MDDFNADGFAGIGQPAAALPVKFYRDLVEDAQQTEEAGQAVYAGVEMIEVRVGRDVLRRPVTDEDKRAYPAVYAAFRADESQEEAVSGTPLKAWPPIKREQAESLRGVGIVTVEQFAAVPDTTLQQVGPLMTLRETARNWLAAQKGGASVVKLSTRLGALEAENATLRAMVERQSAEIQAARNNGGSLPSGPDPRIAEMQAQMTALAAAVQAATAPKRRGRPPKANGV